MIDLEKNYIDLVKWFEGRESYVDWEGFADGQECLALLKKVVPDYDDEDNDLKKVTNTLTLHFIFTRTDTYEMPSEDEVRAVWEAFYELLSARWWMKEDV